MKMRLQLEAPPTLGPESQGPDSLEHHCPPSHRTSPPNSGWSGSHPALTRTPPPASEPLPEPHSSLRPASANHDPVPLESPRRPSPSLHPLGRYLPRDISSELSADICARHKWHLMAHNAREAPEHPKAHGTAPQNKDLSSSKGQSCPS